MDRLPLSVYDFFGYLASGFVLMAALAASFAGSDVWQKNPPAIVAVLLVVDLTYHEAARATGHHVELHADSQGLRDFFAMIHGASVEWDGSDPLREPS
jgi:hypothetical protein